MNRRLMRRRLAAMAVVDPLSVRDRLMVIGVAVAERVVMHQVAVGLWGRWAALVVDFFWSFAAWTVTFEVVQRLVQGWAPCPYCGDPINLDNPRDHWP